MLMRVATLVFLFLICLCFPTSKSIPSIIKERYGPKILKLIRKFGKVDFKFKNEHLIWIFYTIIKSFQYLSTFRIKYIWNLSQKIGIRIKEEQSWEAGGWKWINKWMTPIKIIIFLFFDKKRKLENENEI